MLCTPEDLGNVLGGFGFLFDGTDEDAFINEESPPVSDCRYLPSEEDPDLMVWAHREDFGFGFGFDTGVGPNNRCNPS